MIVMKFGGSSLATGERIAQAAALVVRYRDRLPVVVVSAMGGVTDALLGIASLAVQGRRALPLRRGTPGRAAGAPLDGARHTWHLRG